MAGWLDRWAKRAADAAPVDPLVRASEPPQTPVQPGSSRRDFLKKAGIVGGVAWSVPVMQTVMAPAASASIGTPLGGACTGTGSCANGAANCNGSICGGPGAVVPTPPGCPNNGANGAPTACVTGRCNKFSGLCT